MTYPGGKNASGVYQTLINQIPPHRRYFEIFAGSGAVLRHKKLAEENIAIDIDPEAIELLSSMLADYGESVSVFCENALIYMSGVIFHETDFIYADPPYMFDARKQQSSIYTYEMDEFDHRCLLDALTATPAMVMISGYWTELYAQRLKDWRVVTFEVMTRGGTKATEYVWMNYDQPKLLHDSKWYGENARARDMYNKRRKRLRAKLNRMDFIERQILYETVVSWMEDNQALTPKPALLKQDD